MVTMRRAPDRIEPSSRGAAAVELALITPIMVMIMLGCIDFGRCPSTAIAVRNAARVGAAYASNNPPGSTAAAETEWRNKTISAVKEELGFLTLEPEELAIAEGDLDVNGPTRTNLDGLSQVRVEVVYTFRTVVNWGWPGLGLPSEVDVRQAVVMEEIRSYYTPYDH